ncbi:hypothetical protein CSA37_06225 [Candidatus Fermentibacteria bacterium]|nr:MAG: hypothetical protein CSA37_06225 [Candidatus Fermentibacteria bacterium]
MLAGAVLTAAMTNLEMVEAVTCDALLPVAEQISAHGAETVFLTVAGEHEGSWLLEQMASGILNEAGVTVSTGSREEAPWSLEIRPMELGVTYGTTCRSWALGGRQVPRYASCQLAATLIDLDGNVALTLREGAVLERKAGIGEIPLLESSNESWINGELSSDESGNILEPLVVTGVVTALVYLFYSSRN